MTTTSSTQPYTPIKPEHLKFFRPELPGESMRTRLLPQVEIQERQEDKLPKKTGIGRTVLRSLSRVKPSRVVAVAAGLSLCFDVGIFAGLQIVEAQRSKEQPPQAAAPLDPSTKAPTKATPEKSPTKHAKAEQHQGDKSGAADADAPRMINDASTQNINPHQEKTDDEDVEAVSSSPKPNDKTDSPEPTPDNSPESSEPEPEDTDNPTGEVPNPTPDTPEDTPDPTPTDTTVPELTPSPNTSSTRTAEVTPTAQDAGSGAATALPATILASVVTVH
jgi:hypothetical protein